MDFCLRVDGTPHVLSARQKIHIYRILQEAVTNTIKHANAKHLSIDICYDESGATFTISDDGDGISEHLVRPYNDVTHAVLNNSKSTACMTPTLGLLSMVERAKLINATMSIANNNPSGTIIKLFLSCR